MSTTIEASTELVKRSSVVDMVVAWNESEERIRGALADIASAQQRLDQVFQLGGPDHWSWFDVLSEMKSRHLRLDEADQLFKNLKLVAWRRLIEQTGIRRILSVKRTEELDRQLNTGEGLPDWTVEGILGLMDGTYQQAGRFIEEAVQEVFEYLRPERSRYKTNSELEIGRRVCLGSVVERRSSSKWHVNHYREAKIRALDNVFHALDGRGTVDTHRGPLIDAIEAAGPDGRLETVYFKGRCYNNHALHLEFRRMDLVARLNQMAGGNRLKPGSA